MHNDLKGCSGKKFSTQRTKTELNVCMVKVNTNIVLEFHYTKPLFLMGILYLIQDFSIYAHNFRNATRPERKGWV